LITLRAKNISSVCQSHNISTRQIFLQNTNRACAHSFHYPTPSYRHVTYIHIRFCSLYCIGSFFVIMCTQDIMCCLTFVEKWNRQCKTILTSKFKDVSTRRIWLDIYHGRAVGWVVLLSAACSITCVYFSSFRLILLSLVPICIMLFNSFHNCHFPF
jgi:hypothetical protein